MNRRLFPAPLALSLLLACFLSAQVALPVFAEDSILSSDEETVDTGSGDASSSSSSSSESSAGSSAATGTQEGTGSAAATGASSTDAGATTGTGLAGTSVSAKDLSQAFQTIFTFIKDLLQLLLNALGGNTAEASTGTTGTGATATTGTTGTTGTTATTATTSTGGTTTKTTATVGTGSSAALNAWKGGKLAPTEFVRLLGPAARESMKKTGVPASVTLAQAALETGWGRSTIGSAKNLFGIKGTGPAGSVRVPTKEYIGGRTVTVMANFRKYNNWRESIDDHSQLLLKPRYKNCLKYKNNPDQFARELSKAGYATSPSYASQLISIMKKYNLYQYDR